MSTIESRRASGPSAAARTRPFETLQRTDTDIAGGKGANLGELTRAGFPVPAGFVVCADAYVRFIEATGLRERIASRLAHVNVDDSTDLEGAAAEVRAQIESEAIPTEVVNDIVGAYLGLCAGEADVAVAVRSSATAEDTEAASFAGMNETFLNVKGSEAVVEAVRKCWSSLFGARTVFYRAKLGFGQADMDIAVIVQRQLDARRAGVMFTIDPATRADDRLIIEGAFGLGEAVVSGRVSPDRYIVDKATLTVIAREVHPKSASIELAAGSGTHVRELSAAEAMRATLTDEEAQAIADLGRQIERHYGSPQDTEWAIDGDGRIWMLQSRPVTTTRGTAATAPAGTSLENLEILLHGLGAAPGVAGGPVCRLEALADAHAFSDGDVLVTRMTAPDWVPLMRRAAAIATDSGGMTCHAAIVSRELGIPCVVGTQLATRKLRDRELVTVDATRGLVLEGVASGAGEVEPDGLVRHRRVAGNGNGHESSAQSVRAVAGCTRRRASRRWRRTAPRGADAGGGPARDAPAAAPRPGTWGRVRCGHGGRVADLRRCLLASSRDLSDDGLPHERVPQPRGRRSIRA